jgi:muramoyltetrapeptide carboxypeptidase
MKTPPFIKTGDKIHIVSPAGKVSEKHVFPAVEWLQKQGYKVELGKHVFASHYQFAGTDNQRLDDLQTALDDPETAAIICSRGGYGTVRIIRQIDFSKFVENPKWLVGFSDITILHSCINSRGVATIHGVMPQYFFDNDGAPSENLKSLMQLLTGEKVSYLFKNGETNRPGKVTGELVGGNLPLYQVCRALRANLKQMEEFCSSKI